jgi:hypothetical protein
VVEVDDDAAQVSEESAQTQSFHAEDVKSATLSGAIREGASHARAAVGEVIPGVGRIVRKAVYGTAYGASYGVVFAALSVARLVPTNNFVGQAFKDGAEAARHDVEHLGENIEETVAQAGEEVMPA